MTAFYPLRIIACFMISYGISYFLIEAGVPLWVVCIISFLNFRLFPFKLYTVIKNEEKNDDLSK